MERQSPHRNEVNENTQSPNVDFLVIRENALRCQIVECPLSPIYFLLVFYFGRKSEITDPQLFFLVNEHIAGLNISMDYILFMEIRNAFCDLLGKQFNCLNRHPTVFVICQHMGEEISLIAIL